MNKKEVNKILERIEYCAMKIAESKKEHCIDSAKLSIDNSTNLRNLLNDESMFKSIPAKFKKTITGVYNAGCTHCIECDTKLSVHTLFGFARAYNGIIQIHECKKCFTKQYFHVRTQLFLDHLINELVILARK
jgi:hypothetical protein